MHNGAHTRTAPWLSVVVPVYNEEESAALLYREIEAACSGLGRPYEVLFVDDGSTDKTVEVLAGVADPAHARIIRLRANRGQTAAMAAGFEAARGELIVSLDGDLQNDPADFPKLLEKLDEGFDVVCGWRKNRQDTWLTRKLPSRIANWLIAQVTGVPIRDNGCSLKAYRASVIKEVKLYGELHRFIPSVATLTGARIAEVPVHHRPRRFGSSKYGLSRIWRVCLDIILVKMLISFIQRPLLYFSWLAVPFIVAALVIGAPGILALAGGSPRVWLVSSTAAFVFLYGAAHLVGLGILGELALKVGDYAPSRTITEGLGLKNTGASFSGIARSNP